MKEKHHSGAPVLQLERYLPYRLSILSNRISNLISSTYSSKFALSISEWRIMAVLGEAPGASADDVSIQTQIEKSILSRAISKLLQRHLLHREFDPADRRRSMLKLTATGLSVYREMVPVSYDYEQALLTCFNDAEREQFSELIDRLYEHTQTLPDTTI
ncbi:MAG: MarR family winged helix-turn-helix transcriptional regulator [Porticoccaceae bacterium]|nr:MarR family winged helix-turn-helix transcriptional regulator [Porticoccaceae bacterium]